MNQTEKIAFVNDICTDLKESILKKVSQFPEEWNGYELRQFILDYYETNYVYGEALKGKRKADYKNQLLISPLL